MPTDPNDVKITLEAVDKAKKTVQATKEAIDGIGDQAKSTSRKVSSYNRGMTALSNVTKRAAVATRALSIATKGFSGSMRMATLSVKALKNSLGLVLKPLNMLLGGFGAIAAVKPFATFEREMARVQALFGKQGAQTERDIEILSKKAKELGRDTEYTNAEVAKGMQYLKMAGMSAKQVFDGIKPSLDVAMAGNISVAESADILSNVMSQFGLSGKDFTRVADVMAKTANSANTNISEMGEAFKVFGPVAANIGMSIEEVAGVLGVLADRGLKGSEAVSTLRTAITRLAKDGGPATREMERLGVSAFDSEGKFIGLAELMQVLTKRMANFTEEARLASLSEIFGSRSMSQVLSLMGEGANEAIERTNTLLAEAKGTASAFSKIVGQNLVGDFKRLQSAMAAFFTDFVQGSKGDAIKAAVQFATGWFQALGQAVTQGQASRFLGLSFAAAIEQGFEIIKDAIDALFQKVPWKAALKGFYNAFIEQVRLASQIGVQVVTNMVSVIEAIIDQLIISIDQKLINKTRRSRALFQNLIFTLKHPFARGEATRENQAKINAILSGRDADAIGGAGATRSFGESLAAAQGKVEERSRAINALIGDTLNKIKIKTEEDRKQEAIAGNQVSWSDKLLKLKQELLKTSNEQNVSAAGLSDELKKQVELIEDYVEAAPKPSEEGTPMAEPIHQFRNEATAFFGRDGAFMRMMVDTMNQLPTLAEAIAETFRGAIQGAVDGLSSAIDGLIWRTQNWRDALITVSTAIARSVTRAFSDMLAQWIVKQTMMLDFGRQMDAARAASAIAAENTVHANSRAQAAINTAAWTPAALMKSIATFGLAVAVGVAAMAAISGAFAEGGLVPGTPSKKDNRLAMVGSGEFIQPTAVTQHYGADFMEAIRSKSISVDAARALLGGGSPAPRTSSRYFQEGGMMDAGGGEAGETNINVAIVNGREEADEFFRSNKGRAILIDAINGSKTELGIVG